jgi:hypothetical protein
LRRGFIIWWSGGGPENTPPLDDVVPALSQIRLLGSWTGPVCFGCDGAARGGALSDTLRRSLCKGCLRLFPLTQPLYPLCACHGSQSTVAFPSGLSTHRTGGIHHKRRTGARFRSYAACGRSARSVCITTSLWEPQTTPPTLEDPRVL